MMFTARIIAMATVLAAFAVAGVASATPTGGDATQGTQPHKVQAGNSHSFWRFVKKNGTIERPPDKLIQRKWVHIGSWAIPDIKGAGGAGVHVVYTQPWVVDYFNKHHEFPDGAVLVKQVHAINEGLRTTGPKVYWEGPTAVWFVMVRDRKNRFPNDKRWAKGWGWALFKADDPNTDVVKNWSKGTLTNCAACHAPAKNTHWVYLEGYSSVLDLTEQQKKLAAEH